MEKLLTRIPALMTHGWQPLVGAETGLLHYQNGLTNWFAEAGGNPFGCADDHRGTNAHLVWHGGHALRVSTKIKSGIPRRRLPSDYIECLHFEESGALWIGTFGAAVPVQSREIFRD